MATSKRILQGPGLVVGEFHCEPGDRAWSVENCIGPWHLIAFPRTGVRITHV